ncbi:MAG TPA: nuclease-related domain-containing protein [Acidimicrobiales bacterium]|nr:nuclease-related domain-containing protein [Acidimicrobiales bacterium]
MGARSLAIRILDTYSAEERVAARIDATAGGRIGVLHGRSVDGAPATRASHVAVSPAGVFVVDSVAAGGRLRVRDAGGWSRGPLRMFVGGRDRTSWLDGVAAKTEAVRRLMGPSAACPVHGVLCLVGAELGWLARVHAIGGVLVTWPAVLVDLLGRAGPLSSTEVAEVRRVLDRAMGPAMSAATGS